NGGIAIDVTERVHPDNVAMFVQAAAVVGTDIASMDVISEDISESIWSNGGAILDINIGSGFRNELYPGEGEPRDPGPAIVDMLFPPGRPTRAPIIAVMGDSETASDICTVLAGILVETGASVGLATEQRLSTGGIEMSKQSAFDGART